MRLTEKERLELSADLIGFKLASANADFAVGEFMQGVSKLLESGEGIHLYRALSGIEQIKVIFQRIHNLGHTVGMLAAKAFLETEFPSVPWEKIEFAENANKSGADLRLPEFRIVAELKTTQPCGKSKSGLRPVTFGAQQKANIEKDLQKLSGLQNQGFSKFMFMTSALAFHCLVRDYRTKFPEVCFVGLNDQPKISRPVASAAFMEGIQDLPVQEREP